MNFFCFSNSSSGWKRLSGCYEMWVVINCTVNYHGHNATFRMLAPSSITVCAVWSILVKGSDNLLSLHTQRASPSCHRVPFDTNL